jgi:hypothetical protein
VDEDAVVLLAVLLSPEADVAAPVDDPVDDPLDAPVSPDAPVELAALSDDDVDFFP